MMLPTQTTVVGRWLLERLRQASTATFFASPTATRSPSAPERARAIASLLEDDRWLSALERALDCPDALRPLALHFLELRLPPGQAARWPPDLARRAFWTRLLTRLSALGDGEAAALVHRATGARLSARGGRVGVYFVVSGDAEHHCWYHTTLDSFEGGPIGVRRQVLALHQSTGLPLAGARPLRLQPARLLETSWE